MSIAAVVLGSTGYVGGELLRLIDGHPELQLAAAVSASRSGDPIADAFPHLATAYGESRFVAPGEWIGRLDRATDLALFSAAPHAASAAIVRDALEAADRRDLTVHVVDSSADFRYRDAKQFAAVYGCAHPAPALIDSFFCAVPEHEKELPAAHAGHPGCFATAALLAAVPLVASGLVASDLFISGITGSTGSGRSPQAGTHHPERHSNLYSYKPLAHRHVPEISGLLARATKNDVVINFVPHSGPYARGIYITLQAKLHSDVSPDSLRDSYRTYYQDSVFVRVGNAAPRLKDVVAGNFCHLGVHVAADTAVIMCAIDNLVKGAAGGAMQWMNRLWSLPESSGLLAASPAWT